MKYSADEARSLKAYGELPDSAKIYETDTLPNLKPILGIYVDAGLMFTGVKS